MYEQAIGAIGSLFSLFSPFFVWRWYNNRFRGAWSFIALSLLVYYLALINFIFMLLRQQDFVQALFAPLFGWGAGGPAFFFSTTSLLLVAALLAGVPVVFALVSRWVGDRLTCAVMIDEDGGTPTVLDRATYVFTYLGLKKAGWVYDKACSKYKLLVMKKESSHLRIRFHSREDLDVNLCRAIASASVDSTGLDARLRRLARWKLRWRLASSIAVVGHSESAWTAAMGAVYSFLGLAHVSPYATSKDLHLMVSKISQRAWKKTAPTALISLPPCNDEQLHEIIGILQPIAGLKVMLLADLRNPQYAESFTDGLPRMLALHKPLGEGIFALPDGGSLVIKKIKVATDGTGPDQSDLDEANSLMSKEQPDTIILAGMYPFVKKALEQMGNSGFAKRIIITDGVVSGDKPLLRDGAFSTTSERSIVIMFPHPCMEKETALKGLAPSDASDALSELARVIWSEDKIPDEGAVRSYSEAFKDPNYGYYLFAGSYRVGKCWEDAVKESEDPRFWSLVCRARAKMTHGLFIMAGDAGRHQEEVETGVFGTMRFYDNTSDALPWFVEFPGCSGYSALRLVRAGENVEWKVERDAST